MATPATTPGTSVRIGAVARVLGVPHRFFFLAGVSVLALSSLWWTWVIVARAWPAVPEPPSATLDSTLHALLMTCGFAPFFMFGFVFTAGPRWLGLPPPRPAAWLPGGFVAAAGVLALVPLQIANADLIALRVAAAVATTGWVLLVARFYRMIRASDAP